MPSPSSFRVRFAIVGIGSALALAFLISPGQAQPGRPGGIAGRPPGGIAGGISGTPGGISGISGRPPGSIAGMPGGISGISGRPPGGISGAGISGISGTGISGISGIGGAGIGGGGIGSRYEWTCGKCKGSLGTTITPFNSIQTCPHCGVRFNGTTIDHGTAGRPPMGNFGVPPAPNPAPVMASAPEGANENAGALPTNPAFGNPAPTAATAPPANPPAPASSATGDTGANAGSSSNPEPSGRGRPFWLIGLVVGVILFLGVVAALAVVVSNASATKPARRKTRRPRDDDDDD